ncbi:hypothetical protein [Streptomyces hydrogenans]|uniref:hypothetical protein n=1 Tax=Streptomyces hydrogenans TaxID=1873719 RepID=UPI0037FF30B6
MQPRRGTRVVHDPVVARGPVVQMLQYENPLPRIDGRQRGHYGSRPSGGEPQRGHLAGEALVSGGNGNDVLRGEADAGTLAGGNGADTLDSGSGTDTRPAGPGDTGVGCP